MSAFDISRWALRLQGKAIDRDGAPARQPVQCHDVWLDYLYALGGKAPMGFAPGNGYTDQVWRQFPWHNGLSALFTKHTGTRGIRRGDVIFWSAYVEGGGLPHVAVALDPASGGRVRTVSQDAGKTVQVVYLSTRGVLGYLRPRQAIKPKPASAKPAATGRTNPTGKTLAISQTWAYYATAWNARYRRIRTGYISPGTYKITGWHTSGQVQVLFGNRRVWINSLVWPHIVDNRPATHTVKRGETLGGIAARYGTTWQRLQQINGIRNANVIEVGQVIKLN